jgi:hypothetical protein
MNSTIHPLSPRAPAPGRSIPEFTRDNRLADLIAHHQKDAFLRRALLREDRLTEA